MNSSKRTWKVYGTLPYDLWHEFKNKCDVDDLDNIIIEAIHKSIDQSEE